MSFNTIKNVGVGVVLTVLLLVLWNSHRNNTATIAELQRLVKIDLPAIEQVHIVTDYLHRAELRFELHRRRDRSASRNLIDVLARIHEHLQQLPQGDPFTTHNEAIGNSLRATQNALTLYLEEEASDSTSTAAYEPVFQTREALQHQETTDLESHLGQHPYLLEQINDEAWS